MRKSVWSPMHPLRGSPTPSQPSGGHFPNSDTHLQRSPGPHVTPHPRPPQSLLLAGRGTSPRSVPTSCVARLAVGSLPPPLPPAPCPRGGCVRTGWVPRPCTPGPAWALTEARVPRAGAGLRARQTGASGLGSWFARGGRRGVPVSPSCKWSCGDQRDRAGAHVPRVKGCGGRGSGPVPTQGEEEAARVWRTRSLITFV